MATKERQKRINAAISETKRQLIKAKKRLDDSKKVLRYEREGRWGKSSKITIDAKKKWVKEDNIRVKFLQRHLKNLQKM